MEKIRFLNPSENGKTRALADVCFAPAYDNDDYYLNDIIDSRIAVIEDANTVYAMSHLRRMILTTAMGRCTAWYICYVATLPSLRRRGYMTRLLDFVLGTLKREGEALTFLVPVNKEIYRRFGFVHDWTFRPEEAELLYADDGLSECSACLLNAESFIVPKEIGRTQNFRELDFKPFTAKTAAKLADYFCIRPNKSYDSVPLETLIWAEETDTRYCVVDERCLLLYYSSRATIGSAIPYAAENELVYYFDLLRRYIGEVLGEKVSMYLADEEGTLFLENAGALERFDIEEDERIFDYIYSGDKLRTLSGKALVKKRNHIHVFERAYEGRWAYRTLQFEDADAVRRFLARWAEKKTASMAEKADAEQTENIGCVNLGSNYTGEETLSIDEDGIGRILADRDLFDRVRIGGITIDGELVAFSIGMLNPRENMAVITIEKADPDINGLYQMINREFLLHEFPDAELVNREDDAGVPGLQKAKMSYKPQMFEKRFNIMER